MYAPPTADEYIEQELEPTHRFHDPISKVAWHAMSYSPDGEWLAGGKSCNLFCSRDQVFRLCHRVFTRYYLGAADDASHKIYIWDLAREGLLASTLDGGRELLTYVHVRGTVLLAHPPTD